MEVEIDRFDDICAVTFKDSRLDAKSSILFREKIKNMIDNNNTNIILDFNKINFIDSSGLGAIVSVLKLIGRNGKLVLCGISPIVMNSFVRTKMDKVFIMKSDKEDALKEFI